MGRKVHPYGYRLGVIRDWKSRWFAEGKEYAELLKEDWEVREFIKDEVGHAGISRIEIERYPNQMSVMILTARPGVVIGRSGTTVKGLRSALAAMTDKRVSIDVKEVERAEMDARLVAENIVSQLERRISHNRAMNRAVRAAMRCGAEGIKVMCKGRLFGSEMARTQWQREGRVPLHTLRADIDYAQADAGTSFGRIGVKVWIYKGEILNERPVRVEEEESVLM